MNFDAVVSYLRELNFVTMVLRFLVAGLCGAVIGYSRGMVLSHIQQKHIDAVRISGKYIISKAAIVDFLVSDVAFAIVNKSAWHMNTILMFSNKE